MVAAGGHYTVGLKADGTVVAVGWNYHGQCNVSSWTNVIQVAAGAWQTVGLKSDGTVVAAGLEAELAKWDLFSRQCHNRQHHFGLEDDCSRLVGAGFSGTGCMDDEATPQRSRVFLRVKLPISLKCYLVAH